MFRAAFALIAVALLASGAFAADRVRPIKRVAPDYPVEALKQEITGKVSAWLTVDGDGEVTAVEIASESPKGFKFAEAAEAAFLQWKYPQGQPGRYRGTFTFAARDLLLTADEENLEVAGPPAYREQPKYPKYALDRYAEGEVFAVLTIATDGRVEKVRLVQENPPGYGFGAASEKALEKYRFEPGSRRIFAMTVRYRMEGNKRQTTVALPADGLQPAPEPERYKAPSFPGKAKKAGIREGFVDFGIQIDDDGEITHAGVLAESPAGYDFAARAYSVLESYRFPDDHAGTYALRITFTRED